MAIITKKIWPGYFDSVASGKKKYEIRLNDFDIAPGDTLVLQEWDPRTKEYTGREVRKKIVSVNSFTMEDFESWWPAKDIREKGLLILQLDSEAKS